MLIKGPFPFVGVVTWLTPEEGGRSSGVPPISEEVSYAHAAYALPRSAEDGLASFVLRGWDPSQWRSPAEGRWLLVENEGAQRVTPGTVLMICEGSRAVAHFRVDQVVAG